MKKYFTKYLLDPTLTKQSELVQGDMILWKNEIHKFHSDMGYGCKTYTDYNEENGSSVIVNWSNVIGKVKLSLCSRDIQVGDKFKSIYYPDKEFISLDPPEDAKGDPNAPNAIDRFDRMMPKSCYYTNDGKYIQWIPYSEGFKGIGKISPEATWVKEGDEFDEGDIQILYKKKFECLCGKEDIAGGWWVESNGCEHEVEDHYNNAYTCFRSIEVVDFVKIICPSTRKHFH